MERRNTTRSSAHSCWNRLCPAATLHPQSKVLSWKDVGLCRLTSALLKPCHFNPSSRSLHRRLFGIEMRVLCGPRRVGSPGKEHVVEKGAKSVLPRVFSCLFIDVLYISLIPEEPHRPQTSFHLPLQGGYDFQAGAHCGIASGWEATGSPLSRRPASKAFQE